MQVRSVRLKTKITLAFCLAGPAAMAGLLPSYLAFSTVEARLAEAFSDTGDPHLAETAGALLDRVRFGLLALVPGVTCIFLALAVLALLGQRAVITPLRNISAALARVGSGDLTPPTPLRSGDEIGDLSRTLATMLGGLDQLVQDRASELATLSESVKRYRDLTRLAADFVWETDAQGRVTYFSGRFVEGAETQALIGKPLDLLMSVTASDKVGRALELNSRRPLRNLLCSYGTDGGARRYCRLSGHALTDESGGFLGYRGIAHDVTEHVAAEEHAQARAFRDPLTGLGNTTLIRERIEQALAARSVSKGGVAVIHVDLDRFKAVNDGFGDAIGDALLREVAARLAACAGPRDSVARVGGDGFVCLQAAAAGPEAAERLCLSILQSLRRPFRLDGQSVTLTASLGCALAGAGEGDAITLLRNAQIAMYRAKDDGRDTFRFHDRVVTAALQTRMRMERDLRLALQSGGIRLQYQPVMRAAPQGLAGFEACMRWARAGHGLVYPEDFLPLAEATGLIVPLTTHMLADACGTAQSWSGLTVAAKLSPAVFLQDSLLPTIVQSLRDSTLPACLLEIEITEDALCADADRALFQFDALRDLGVRLVMDDFGSGTCSLRTLQRFPFDKLKLHRGFVAGVDSDPARAEIVHSVLALAAALGLDTAADGIVTKAQASVLTGLGCRTLQGPLFGEALTAARAVSRVRREGVLTEARTAETGL